MVGIASFRDPLPVDLEAHLTLAHRTLLDDEADIDVLLAALRNKARRA
jgi:hypothetical protein